MELVIGFYKWLYETMVYRISFEVCEWFMGFLNSFISQWKALVVYEWLC